MFNAKLLVLEGLDSSGKGTQLELIKKYCEKHNYKYAYIHFPIYRNNEASNIIAAYLRGEYGDINKVNPVFVANIYAMDRFLYLPELQKQLGNNDVVLLDRYVFSNMAYQGAKYDTETQANIIREWIAEFEFGFLELPYPDLNIFFDVPIEIIEQRLNEIREGNDREYLNGKKDIHEKDIEYQKKVRDNYIALRNYQNFEIIETGNLSSEDVFKKYEKLLDRLMLIF
jgi:dTMP kinase